MQIFSDTGAKFHEFPPLTCEIAEESLTYDNLLNNERMTKKHIYYMYILGETHILSLFKMKVKANLAEYLLSFDGRKNTVKTFFLRSVRIKLTQH